MKLDIKEKLRAEIPSYATIGVALSGGRDSVALFDLLLKAGFNIKAIHVEHGIRGKSSLSDAKFVEDMCAMRGVELKTYRVDAKKCAIELGLTLEQAARKLRYERFEDALNAEFCDYIALAHHADDQAETILMRILRGTGVKGLCGMQEASGKYLRPLLSFSREDINAYVRENSLEFCEDETNSDAAYSRNFLRQELAKIKTRYPNLTTSFARLAANAEEIERYLARVTPKVEVHDGEAYVNDLKTDDLIFKRQVREACESLGVYHDVESRHYDLLLALRDGETSKSIDLTNGLVARKQTDCMVISFFKDEESLNTVPLDAVLNGEACGATFEVIEGEEARAVRDELLSGKLKPFGIPKTLYADLESVIGAVVRARRAGDVIKKMGGGSKTLGDFFTDLKIPSIARDSIPVIAKDSEVLAAAGVEISYDARVTNESERILKINLKNSALATKLSH